MRRSVFLITVLLTAGVGLLLTLSLSTSASGSKGRESKGKTSTQKPAGAQGSVSVTITPAGRSQTQIDVALRAVNAHPTAKKYLRARRIRQLEFELLEPQPYFPREQYRVTFYDYTHNRPVLVVGTFGDSRLMTVTVGAVQPLPSPEEFDAAVEVIKNDPKMGPALIAGKLQPYRPMPPLASESVLAERTLHVGLFGGDAGTLNQIVAVNMIRNTVSAYKSGAPPTALAAPTACGVPGAGQAATSRGTAGQAVITVTQGGQTIWEMLVIRPSASSGTRGSGVELRDVKYRGKSVFKRAHVPILNVHYDFDACGPYRDWQWQEGMFLADGTDIAAGVRMCATAPQTIMEAGSDAGNFRGVAVYKNPVNDELLLVSEMEAGWYRYVSRWEFTTDGVIRARFGFDGIDNSCVCNAHHHNAYWRFDFDPATAGRSRFTEYGTFAFNSPILTEAKRYRDYVRNRHWSIENIVSGELIRIMPGHHDGVADFYARGDAWFLRYRGTELDDGRNSTGSNTEADLDMFVNGEALDGQDVVMWYSGHFDHVDGVQVSHPEDNGGHIVGPDIIVARW
ncbi:MAG: hypothetical protein ACRD9Y_13500 [Blastocatellia bacterium]